MNAFVRSLQSPRFGAASLLRLAASLRLTVVLIVLLAVAVAFSFDQGVPATWTLALPLGAMAVNLLAAVATHPTFRRQTWLLAFHLALIALLLLVATGRLIYLRGTLELSQGEVFAGNLLKSEAGPLHPWRLAAAAFTHDGFEIDYAPGLRRGPTRHPVRWRDEDGRPHRAVIGDQTPLVLHGYRFYTTSNKGFAARVTWRPDRGGAHSGTLHFPSFPVFEFDQNVDWTLPDTATRIRLSLELPAGLIDAERASTLRPPVRHALKVAYADGELLLQPGQSLRLADGELAYEGLGTWMGYTVHYDPTLPWLLAAALIAVVALSAHFWRKFAARPWRPT